MSINNFASIQVQLASPETILKWSHGEVTKPETINYRSQKAEKDGLFCERIFGPTKDWECACGKYKKVRFKGVVCDRCGVEITKSSVRRERMGHIHLAAPVAHIWYLRGIPSRMALLLDVTPKQLEEVVYFVSYIVTDPKDSDLAYKQILSEREYRENLAKFGPNGFTAQTGAEAVLRLLKDVDLEKEYEEVQSALEKAQGEKRKKLIKRLDTINAFRHSDNKPEWMILTNIPVIPPDLRPMLQLDGGRFATSDLNDLYRRVITRNNRLHKLLELGTPNIIVQNEKRMLQEAVDALIDNGRRSKPITGAGGRALKSLSHSLKGKQGRFRQNLLGKRVDFSGRSVIAVGPDLKMYQCGIPREMAINLFNPFIINEIVNQGLAANPKNAEKLIERRDPRIWDVVEKVIEGYPVLMNRAPTLHRLGIQAFLPKLVEGRAMRLHPLVCTAFNADFDGDQMAIHVPLGEEARAEALIMMLGSHNILGPKDGKPIVTPGQDMVMGNFYLTMEETKEELLEESKRYESTNNPLEAANWKKFAENEGNVYANEEEVKLAYQIGQVHLHSRIAVPVKGFKKTSFGDEHANDYLATTVGKIIFNGMFPADFPYLNEVSSENFKHTPDKYFIKPGQNIKKFIEELPITPAFKKKDLGSIIAEVFKRYSVDETAETLDQIKSLGFKYSTTAGITVALSDIEVAPNKEMHVDEGRKKAEALKKMQQKGLLTLPEWESRLNKMWDNVKDGIADELMANMPRKNPIFMMSESGARGNKQNFTQLAGMRGLMARPGHGKSRYGEFVPSIIEVPIYSCFREGLNVSEFFISTHGVRKGLTDTALKTAESGYLTRRLVDVAQDVIIKEDDCGTDKGYWVETLIDRKTNTVIEELKDRLVGRYSKQDVVNPETGELIIASDEYITDQIAQDIVDAGITGMYIRSPFTCKSSMGICRKCYGKNMATGKDVEVGEAVGIMAAQSIGEPGTQLTMRTFHTGGVAGSGTGDITQGLPRVEELFEARHPKGVAVIAQISGEITSIERIDGTMRQEVIITNEHESAGA
ncbi:DNA-directed RNA polymerase subunit beta' [Dubosiella newyorkensis]|uniref:DNA-directed RNA polymerase subunit beta' n=1 Tax=Dubosiella newyorkensis TaxID=1862672 RepID=UPI003F66E28D